MVVAACTVAVSCGSLRCGTLHPFIPLVAVPVTLLSHVLMFPPGRTFVPLDHAASTNDLPRNARRIARPFFLLGTTLSLLLLALRRPSLLAAWLTYVLLLVRTALFSFSGIQPIPGRYSYLLRRSQFMMLGFFAGAACTEERRSRTARPAQATIVVSEVLVIGLSAGISRVQGATWSYSKRRCRSVGMSANDPEV